MTVEEKALALVKKARQFCTSSMLVDVLCRDLAGELEHAIEREQAAIEAHEADKKAFSDAVAGWVKADRKGADARRAASEYLLTFILPEPEPDPLVEAVRDTGLFTGYADTLRQAIEAHGGKIVWEQEQ